MEASRRQFISMTGAAALAGIAGTALAEPKEASPVNDPVINSDLDMFHTHVSVEDLNKIRREQVEAVTEDWVCADGRVIPKIWVKVRMFIDGLGRGIGGMKNATDSCFDFWMYLCNNDENLAEILINLPVGVRFTTTDAVISTGKPLDEVKAALDALSFNGLVFHTKAAGVDLYNVQRNAHGILEAMQNLYDTPGVIPAFFASSLASNDVPFGVFHTIPCDPKVVAEDTIYPLDDIEYMLERNEIFAVSPCQCHYFNKYLGGALYTGDRLCDVPPIGDWDAIKDFKACDGTSLEKCVTFGEEAEYYISIGIGRQLTREEAREHLQRATEENCIRHAVSTNYCEVICNCSGPCLIMLGERALVPGTDGYANCSDYNLMYDSELCVKCGLCANRCPMKAIEMNAEGYPEVTGICVRCGQCAYVCPMEARKLTLKELDQIPNMPADLLGTINAETSYLVETGQYPETLD